LFPAGKQPRQLVLAFAKAREAFEDLVHFMFNCDSVTP
jgi:hypothetical protein